MPELIGPEALPTRLKEEGLSIFVTDAASLEDNYIQQLVEKSQQPHIQAFEGHEDVGTPEVPGRFRSIEDYRAWASSKQRMMLMLVDATKQLDADGTPDIGGIAWFGNRENRQAPGRSVTFAMRNYAASELRQWAQYTGRGLAVPFMDTAHKLARDIYPNEKLWLDLVEGNNASLRMCLRNGYQEIVRHDDTAHGGQSRIVMVNDTAFMRDPAVSLLDTA
jgi:hypothetical protein